MTENHRGMRRMRHSEAAKAKIAAANRGKVMSTEARAKIAAANRGKVVSNETKAKMAEAQRQRWAVKRDAKRAINVEAGEGADGGEPAPRVMGQRT